MNKKVACLELALDLCCMWMCVVALAGGLVMSLSLVLSIANGYSCNTVMPYLTGIVCLMLGWLPLPASSLGCLAYIFYLSNQYAKAEKFFRLQEVVSCKLKLGRYPGREIWSNGWIAHCLHKQSRWAESRDLYQQVFSAYQELKSPLVFIAGFEIVFDGFQRLLLFLDEPEMAHMVHSGLRKPLWLTNLITYSSSITLTCMIAVLTLLYSVAVLSFTPECLLQAHAYRAVEAGVYQGWFSFGAVDSTASQRLIARSVLGQGRFAECEKILRTQLTEMESQSTKYPEDLTAILLYLGDALSGQHRFSEAASMYTRAQELSRHKTRSTFAFPRPTEQLIQQRRKIAIRHLN